MAALVILAHLVIDRMGQAIEYRGHVIKQGQ